MAALRHPETGCPWDRQQDFATIAPYTIEEAYEVADAIAAGDFAALPDELGDLLFQVVYHARMAEEAGHFALADVARAISDKMIRRHPHVFGAAAADFAALGDAQSFEAKAEAIRARTQGARRTSGREARQREQELKGGMLVEKPWEDVAAALPPPLHRHRYGA